MKQFAILIAAITMIGFMTTESQAQHYHRGHHHGRNIGYGGSNFNLSIGNGFNGISYGRGYGYGGYARPVYRPVYNYGGFYGGNVYRGYGGYNRGVSINIGRGYGGYGGYGGGYYRPGCGGW